jgi:outer membrane protein insertion porin family
MRIISAVPAFLIFATLIAACKEGEGVQVHSLKFNGVKAVDESRLRNALATREGSKLPWGRKRFFERSRFETDLKRIEAFYNDRGYPDVRVTGVDVKMNDKQTAVDITVTLVEGDPVRVVAINLAGFEHVPAEHLATLKNDLPLKVGTVRDRQLVVSAREMASNELKDHGFPYAKVSADENDGASGKEATLTLTAEPGQMAYIGQVQITGNNSVSDNVIRRQLTFKPGDLYQRSAIQDSQRRLYGLALFQFANVTPVDVENQPAEVPVRVTVAEGRHQRVNFGVGYGTEEKARVDAEYHHLNFFGGARSAGVHARYSSLDRGVRLDFTQPYVFTPHFSLTGEGQQWFTYTPAYRSKVAGGKLTLTHRESQRLSWSISLTSEHDVSTIEPEALNDPTLRNDLIALGLNPVTGEQNGTLSSVGFDIQWTTADNVLNAHRGYQLAFHAEDAGRLLPGTFNFYALTTDARHYLPLGKKLVIASRAQLAGIRPLNMDDTNVPFSKKFFLGGASSIRGWGRFEVSPLSSGLPIGGNAMFAWSEEVRAILRGNIGGVLFLDAGNVWAKSGDFNFNDLRYAVGSGLRYQTPIGPMRFDYGYQINPIPGLLVNGHPQTRRWRIHFSIGQAF